MLTDNPVYYVYLFLDPTKPGKYGFSQHCFLYAPIYIGKGKDYRYNEHFNPSKRKRCSHLPFYRKLEQIIAIGLKPICIFLGQNLTEKEAWVLEMILIQEMGKIGEGGLLYNLLKGGPCRDGIPPEIVITNEFFEEWKNANYKSGKWNQSSPYRKRKKPPPFTLKSKNKMSASHLKLDKRKRYYIEYEGELHILIGHNELISFFKSKTGKLLAGNSIVRRLKLRLDPNMLLIKTVQTIKEKVLIEKFNNRV